jgi:putative FmdB family regulatory protein
MEINIDYRRKLPMPAYDYLCDACGYRFEKRQKMSDAVIELCPECGGKVNRLISGGTGVISKGDTYPSGGCLQACGSGAPCCGHAEACHHGQFCGQ